MNEPANNKIQRELPGPDERPNRDLVIYDGECHFCTSQITRLSRWDRQGRLAFLSLHDPEVYERYPDLTHDQLMEEMFVITPAGIRYQGADGFRYLTMKLPILWPLVPFLNFPGTLPLWSWCYRKFAERRYLFNKRNGECVGTCDLHFNKKPKT